MASTLVVLSLPVRPILLITCCVALGKSLHLSGPILTHSLNKEVDQARTKAPSSTVCKTQIWLSSPRQLVTSHRWIQIYLGSRHFLHGRWFYSRSLSSKLNKCKWHLETPSDRSTVLLWKEQLHSPRGQRDGHFPTFFGAPRSHKSSWGDGACPLKGMDQWMAGGRELTGGCGESRSPEPWNRDPATLSSAFFKTSNHHL